MKNKWKTAFWILLIVFLFTTSYLAYAIVDQRVTITYMREGYGDTERDLEQLSRIIEGKLTYADFKEISDRYDVLGDSTSLGLNRINIVFGPDRKIKKVTTEW